MSYAVMPLADYKNFCDTVREHFGANLLENATFEKMSMISNGYISYEYGASSRFRLIAGKEYTLDLPNITVQEYPACYAYICKSDWDGKESTKLFTAMGGANQSPFPYHFTPTETAEYRVFLEPLGNDWSSEGADATLICNGATETIKSGEMADKVNDVHEFGKQAGHQAEYDRFWDLYQESGTRTSYLYAFCGKCWTDETFKPKYPLIVANANQMFTYNSGLKNLDYEIEITATGDSARYMFSNAWVERIKLLKVKESLKYTSIFASCTYLTDITFDGVIGNSIGFGSCPLNYDSIISIIEHLSSTSTGQTLTLKKSAVDKAFECSVGANDGTTNPNSYWNSVSLWKPNWTITLA